MRVGSALCALMLACLGWTSTSRAENGVPPEYTEAVKQALQELDMNDLPEALAEFRRAHEIFPNARSLRGMGMIEFDLRDYRNAVLHLQEALTSNIKPLTGKMRTETEGLLDRARRYVGELRIATDPADATILVDGSPAELRPDGAIWLNLGDHLLEVSAPGRLSDTRTVQVSGGEQRQLVISLRMVERTEAAEAAAVPAPVQPAPAGPAHSERTPAYRKWWVWTLVAVAVVGAGTTAAVLLTRRDEPAEQPVQGTNTTGVTLHALRSF